MDIYCGAAAKEAEARAAACRARRQELAARPRLAHSDAARAQEFLARATERATMAQYRLTRVRSRVQARALLGWGAQRAGDADAEELRARAAQLPMAQLHLAYRSIGGRYDQLELDAFIHAALDWPPGERQVLEHAAWELTEFPS
jgi:hypothetical protein